MSTSTSAPKKPVRDLLLIIENQIYEVSAFVRNHPGEGIHNIYLRDFSSKDVSQEYQRYHLDELPDEWLLQARTQKFVPNTGIAYLGPSKNYFPSKSKIPGDSRKNGIVFGNFFEITDD